MILKAQKRTGTGTRAARQARKEGKIPAIIYGHKQEPIAVLLNYHDFTLELQHHHRVMEIEVEGKVENLMVKEVQFDYLGDTIIHADLARVDLNETVQVTVEVELKGTPAELSGGIVDQQISDVEIECLVSGIPGKIRVNIAGLASGKPIVAGDLELPDGAKLITDASNIVVALTKVAEEEVVEDIEGEESSEPEVITREKSEDEPE